MYTSISICRVQPKGLKTKEKRKPIQRTNKYSCDYINWQPYAWLGLSNSALYISQMRVIALLCTSVASLGIAPKWQKAKPISASTGPPPPPPPVEYTPTLTPIQELAATHNSPKSTIGGILVDMQWTQCLLTNLLHADPLLCIICDAFLII